MPENMGGSGSRSDFENVGDGSVGVIEVFGGVQFAGKGPLPDNTGTGADYPSVSAVITSKLEAAFL